MTSSLVKAGASGQIEELQQLPGRGPSTADQEGRSSRT
jgi:hypothetical protein